VSKRADILTATRDLLWERGYEATSPRAVMDRSGAGQGSLYHHFADKKQLAITALNAVEAQLTDELSTTLDDLARTPLTRILAWLDLQRDALQGCRLGRLAFERTVIEDDELRAPLARYFQGLEYRLRSTLAQAVETKELPPQVNVDQLATLVITTVQGGYLLSRVLHDPEQLQHAVRGAHTLLLLASSSKES